MSQKELSISGLYYRYGKRSDDEIRQYLKDIKIVVLTVKEIGSEYGYYPLSEKSMDKISTNPRKVSLSFDATATDDQCLKNLKVYKTIKYLVKSTSRFFLKPDIGEIFDQLDYRTLTYDHIKAIQYLSEPIQVLPDTNEEHFILEANLLIDEADFNKIQSVD